MRWTPANTTDGRHTNVGYTLVDSMTLWGLFDVLGLHWTPRRREAARRLGVWS